MSRTTRLISGALFASILLGAFPLHISPTYAITEEPISPTGMSLQTLPLSRAATLAEVAELTLPANEDVVGYQYSNENVSGQFYPTPDRPISEFEHVFEEDFGTAPQVTGVVVLRETEPDGQLVVPLETVVLEGKEFAAPPTDAQLLEELRGETVAPDNNANRSSSTEWRPEFVTARIRSDTESATFSQYIEWGSDASPHNVPDGYGMEVDFNVYNPDHTFGIDPFCPVNQEFDFFAAKNQWLDWQVITFGDTAGLGPISAYRDITQGDFCSRASFAIGLRYPQNLPEDEGVSAILTRVEVERGTELENVVDSQISLLDDAKCRDDEANNYSIWLGYCMGLWEIEPVGIPVSRTVLSTQSGWVAPDRCWYSTGYGEVPASPSQECGQQLITEPAVDVDSFNVSGSSPGTREYELTVALPPSTPSWLLNSFPDAFDQNGSVFEAVGDVRAWIGGAEVQVGRAGWQVNIPSDLQSLTLTHTNAEGVPGVSSGTLLTLRELAADGFVSFRRGDNPPVLLRLDNVDMSISDGGDELSSIRARNCWGTEPDWPEEYEDAGILSEQSDPTQLQGWANYIDPTYYSTYNDGLRSPESDPGCIFDVVVPLSDNSKSIASQLPNWQFDLQYDNTSGEDQNGRPLLPGTYGNYSLVPDATSTIQYSYWDGTTFSPFATTSQGFMGNSVTLDYTTYSDYWFCWDVDDCVYRAPTVGGLDVRATLAPGAIGIDLAESFRRMEYFGGKLQFYVDSQLVTLQVRPQQGYSFVGLDPYQSSGPCGCETSRSNGNP